MSEEKAGDAVPAAQRGSWTSFLKSISGFSGDLSSMTAPPFILSPVSLTEFPAYWCERPDLFNAIADAASGEARAVAVLRWFISTLKDQYTSRNETMGSEKKPLNPVLGELFYGKWPDTGSGQINLLVEQVSHHPPITAYVIENKSKNIKLVGHNAQKTTFSGGSIIVKQIGHAVLTVGSEEYLITLPKLRIDGLWYGSPYIELTDSTYIIGPSHLSTVEFKGKGYFSGKSHSVKAVVSPISSPSVQIHVIDGTWHTTSKFSSGPRKGTEFHNVEGQKQIVTAVAGNGNGEEGDYETRKLWKDVAKGIRGGDFESASVAKTKIENDQRALRKEETAKGTHWELKHFDKIASDPTYERLGQAVSIQPPQEDAYVFKGNWPENAY
ncbi:oxysterol binding protein [Flagelloscypha sp. PMI_526]|nr:oxysterol binding protein [Flagelloscypha sp. PMI_526]